MKKLIVIVLVIGLSLSGCIKSLHSIVGEGDRILDERIEGVWTNGDKETSISNISISDPLREIDFIDSIGSIDFFESMEEDFPYKFWEISRAADSRWIGKSSELQNVISMDVGLENMPENFDFNDISPQSGISYKLKEKVLHDYYILSTNQYTVNRETEYKIAQLTQIGENYFLDISEKADEEADLGFFDFLYPNISGHSVVKIEFDGDKIKLYEFAYDYMKSLIKEKRIRLKHEMVNDEIVLTASTEQLRAFLTKYGSDKRLFLESSEFYTHNFG